MNQRFDTILKSGTVVNQDGAGVRDIGVIDGRIAEIGGLSGAAAADMIDCKGLHILPGVIDTQVHFREPGLTHKEDLETGSRSAVMGGVTAVFEMPNTNPLTVDEPTFTEKVKRGRGRMHCDFAFFIGGTRDNVQDLPELERAPGCAGVKVFIGSSTGALLVEDDESLRRIFQVIRAAPPSMPRTNTASTIARGCASKAIRARIRYGATRPRRCSQPSAWSSSPMRPASGSTCCIFRPNRRSSSSGITRMSPPARRRRITSPWLRPNAISGSAPARR